MMIMIINYDYDKAVYKDVNGDDDDDSSSKPQRRARIHPRIPVSVSGDRPAPVTLVKIATNNGHGDDHDGDEIMSSGTRMIGSVC